MKLSTIWSAYRKAEEFHEVYPALTQERQMDTFSDALTRKIEALERPATQCCPQCEAKQRQIDALTNERDTARTCIEFFADKCKELEQANIELVTAREKGSDVCTGNGGLKARIDNLVERAVQANVKITDLQDTIDKQRYIQRARGVLRIAELEAENAEMLDILREIHKHEDFEEVSPETTQTWQRELYPRAYAVVAAHMKHEVNHE